MSDGDLHLLDPATPDLRYAMCDVRAVGPGTYFPAQVTCQACLAARIERRAADPGGYTIRMVLRGGPATFGAAADFVGERIPFMRNDDRGMKPEVVAAEDHPEGVLVTLYSPDRFYVDNAWSRMLHPDDAPEPDREG